MGKGRLPVTGIIAKNSVVAAGFPVNGSLLANEEVDLVAEIVGKVRKIYFQEGVAVKKGQLLLKVDDADLQAQLTRAEFQKKLLAEKLERQRILLKRESISREAFDQLLGTVRSILPLIRAEQSRSLLLVTLYGCTNCCLDYEQAHAAVDPWRGELLLKKSKAQLLRRLDDYDCWLGHRAGSNG